MKYYEHECGELTSQLLQRTLMREQCFNQPLVLNSDNGPPMKSLTLKAKMEELFVCWYNKEHKHSLLKYVTPSERYDGRDRDILQRRWGVLSEARTLVWQH